MLICGEEGMGQGYIGAAVLHHLEGFHVQTLDLATLVADSGRTMEAACVQLFVEAKRHKPSILFIPSLATWCLTVTDTVKSTVKGLLDGLDSSDPILLLAVVDGPISELPPDVRGWFGFVKGNRVVMQQPGAVSLILFLEDAGSTLNVLLQHRIKGRAFLMMLSRVSQDHRTNSPTRCLVESEF